MNKDINWLKERMNEESNPSWYFDDHTEVVSVEFMMKTLNQLSEELLSISYKKGQTVAIYNDDDTYVDKGIIVGIDDSKEPRTKYSVRTVYDDYLMFLGEHNLKRLEENES